MATQSPPVGTPWDRPRIRLIDYVLEYIIDMRDYAEMTSNRYWRPKYTCALQYKSEEEVGGKEE